MDRYDIILNSHDVMTSDRSNHGSASGSHHGSNHGSHHGSGPHHKDETPVPSLGYYLYSNNLSLI